MRPTAKQKKSITEISYIQKVQPRRSRVTRFNCPPVRLLQSRSGGRPRHREELRYTYRVLVHVKSWKNAHTDPSAVHVQSADRQSADTGIIKTRRGQLKKQTQLTPYKKTEKKAPNPGRRSPVNSRHLRRLAAGALSRARAPGVLATQGHRRQAATRNRLPVGWHGKLNNPY